MQTNHRAADALTLVEIARQFPDDVTARAFLEKTRWPDGPVCPHCGTVNNAHAIPANVDKKVRPGLYLCREKACAKQFTVTVGTVFEASKVSLSNWLIAWHLVCASKKGIAALELQRLLGIGSYKTAWFMLMRIRESLKSGSFDGSPLKGDVEADASFIGGKRRGGGIHAKKYETKRAIVAVVQRDGAARSFIADKETRAVVQPILHAQIDPSARLLTDGAHAYKAPGLAFAAHESVEHTAGEYVRGDVHTGTVDAFHGLIKRGHYGTWHSLSPKYLARYLTEFDFRFTLRNVTDGTRTARSLRDMGGKRLRYVDLTASSQKAA